MREAMQQVNSVHDDSLYGLRYALGPRPWSWFWFQTELRPAAERLEIRQRDLYLDPRAAGQHNNLRNFQQLHIHTGTRPGVDDA